jgi:ATP-dependent Clp protease ATP-binding subunit ClpB
MDINRFTEKLQEALRTAQSETVRLSHQQLDVEHVFSALLRQEGGLAPSQRVTSQNPEATYQALEKYGRDLTSWPSRASSTR